MSIDVPRNSNDIRAELNELNSLIIDYKTMIEFYPEDTALKVAMKQLFDRRDALVREIRASKQNEYKSTYSMKLEGDSISNGEIPASVFSGMVESFQEIINSIINKMMKGEQSRGKISNDILNMSEIKVAATASGSFKILFTGSSTLEPNGEDIIQTKAMNILSDIISQSVSSEKMEKIKREMGPRTISKFKRMVEIANRNDISITLFEDDENLKKATLANNDTKSILDIINEIEMKPDEEITLVGRLFDINFDQRKFKISSTDGQVVNCDKIELNQKQINTLNNQAKYSVVFTIKRSYRKTFDKEFSTYIARFIEILDAHAYSDIDDPKAVSTEKRPST